MPDALSLRPTNRLIYPFLAWLKENGGEKTQSAYLREWLERGFSLWLMELAVTDPVLYARAISEADQLDAAAMERMGAKGQEALQALLVTLIEGIGECTFCQHITVDLSATLQEVMLTMLTRPMTDLG